MSFKINEQHWALLLDFMEKHPSFARGQFSGPTGKATQRKLWEELSQKLNSLGYGEKPTEKWQKTWADMKYILKKKSSNIKKDFSVTGGGPSLQSKLSTFEERILGILGRSFSEGVGSTECGIIQNQTPDVPVAIPSTSKNMSEFEFQIIEFDEVLNPKTSDYRATQKELSSENAKTTNPTDDLLEKATIIDHTYCQAPKNKKKRTAEDRENELYHETIEELRSIKKGVFSICDHLNKLNETLIEIKTAVERGNP